MHLVTVSATVTLSRLSESGTTDFSENKKKDSNAGHASHVMFTGGGGGGRRKGGGGAHGIGGGRGKGKGGRRGQQGRGGKSTDEGVGGSVAAAGGVDSSAKTAEGGTSEERGYRRGKKDHWRVDCTEELCSRCYGRGHAPDVCRRSKKDAVLAVSYNDDGDNTVGASTFKVGETGECSDVFGGKGERGVGLAGR